MKIAAIVPVKSLAEAKSRLAGELSPTQRAELARAMLSHVLEVVIQSREVSSLAVISPNPGEIVLPPGVTSIKQDRHGLNNLLEQGREWALREGADAIMVIFADLPLLSPFDISGMVRLGQPRDSVVLAPDGRRVGTNVLLAHPVALARFAFGPDSYAKHTMLHQQVGAVIKIYSSTGTSLDIDTPDDLSYLEDRLLLEAS